MACLQYSEMKIGMKIIFHNRSWPNDMPKTPYYYEGMICEVVKIEKISYGRSVKMKVLSIPTYCRMNHVGQIISPANTICFLHEEIPHVYNPVLMTGRYRTIGD